MKEDFEKKRQEYNQKTDRLAELNERLRGAKGKEWHKILAEIHEIKGIPKKPDEDKWEKRVRELRMILCSSKGDEYRSAMKEYKKLIFKER